MKQEDIQQVISELNALKCETLKDVEDARVHFLGKKGVITALSAPEMNVMRASVAPDGKHFVTFESKLKTPWRWSIYDLKGKQIWDSDTGPQHPVPEDNPVS